MWAGQAQEDELIFVKSVELGLVYDKHEVFIKQKWWRANAQPTLLDCKES